MSRRSPMVRALLTLAGPALALAACGGAGTAAPPPPATVHIVPPAGVAASPVAAGPVTTTTTAPTTSTSLPGSVHYEVAAGDTLYGIATRFGTTVDVLTKLNPLKDVNRLLVGQDLIVPNPALTGAANGTAADAGTGSAGGPVATTTSALPVIEEQPEELTPEPTASTLPAATKDG